MNIFLDTSIFIKNNFLASYSIKQLLLLSENLKIQIYITDIVKREYLKNLDDSFTEFTTSLSKNPIWKNTDFKDFQNIQEKHQNSNFYQKIRRAFEEKINQGIIKVIDTPNEVANSVIDLYFDCNPPFDDKRKKYEFLDAFILLTIENWCIKNNSNAILFSSDTDQLKFKSNLFKIESDFNNILEKFVDKSIKIENTPIGEKIDELVKINLTTINEQIKYIFESEFNVELSDNKYRLESLKVIDLDSPNYKVLSATKFNALIEYPVCIHYKYKIYEPDYENDINFIIEDDNYFTVPFEVNFKLDKGIKKGGYDLIQVDIKSNYKRIKINCG